MYNNKKRLHEVVESESISSSETKIVCYDTVTIATLTNHTSRFPVCACAVGNAVSIVFWLLLLAALTLTLFPLPTLTPL